MVVAAIARLTDSNKKNEENKYSENSKQVIALVQASRAERSSGAPGGRCFYVIGGRVSRFPRQVNVPLSPLTYLDCRLVDILCHCGSRWARLLIYEKWRFQSIK